MKFNYISNKIVTWKYDPIILDAVLQQSSEGTTFQSSSLPGLTPSAVTIKMGGLTHYHLILEWKYVILTSPDKHFFDYEFHAAYEYTPNDYEYEDVRKVVAKSFDLMIEVFEVQNQMEYSMEEIPEPDLGEFDALCQHTWKFLRPQTE